MQSKKSKQKVKRQPQNANINATVQKAVSAALKQIQPAMNPKGNSFLGDIGQFAGNGISKIFGLGAYKITRNSLYSAATGAQVPFMHSSSESVVFRHREYIGEVTSSNAFTTTTFPVNPGMPSTFPYLSTIASCFEEYKFRGLIFEFKSTGADAIVNGTNSSLGTVGLAAQYRSDAPALSTKVEFLNQMWATDCKTSQDTILPIECAPKENAMPIQYIRSGAPSGDIKNYDLCQLVVATNGSPGTNVVGELWASYEIELFKPTVTPTGGTLAADHYTRSSATGFALFGTTVGTTGVSTIGAVVAGSSLTFPVYAAGKYLVSINHSGGAVTTGVPAPTIVNGTFVPIFNGSNLFTCPGGGSTSLYSMMFMVNITSVGQQCVVSAAACVLPTNATVEVNIVEVPDFYA